jgi:hypothetical protein
MSQVSIKKLLYVAVATVAVSLQFSVPVLAATDDEVVTAAQNGTNYLAANQNNDGSTDGSATEWTVIAVQAAGQQASQLDKGSGVSATDFLKADKPTATSTATDVERKIIAIASTGQSSTNFGGVDYDATLATYHVDKQIGDPTLLNDDIFGVIAADATGNPSLHNAAQDALDYFLAHQSADGGFSYTTDTCPWCGSDSNDTAAAIIALHAAEHLQLTNVGLVSGKADALVYLLSTQQPDGGFGYDIYSPSDGSSTAWSLMALNIIGDPVRVQALAARNWLLANQNSDGGFTFGAYGVTASDTYTTAHAVIALLGTTWLLQPTPLHAGSASSLPVAQSTATTAKQATVPNVAVASAKTVPNVYGSSNKVLGSTATDEGTHAGVVTNTPSQTTAATATATPVHPAKNHRAIYGTLALLLIALGWFVVQSRHSKEGV